MADALPNRAGTQALGALVHALRSIHADLPRHQLLEVLLDMAIEISAAGRGFIVLPEGEGWRTAVARNYERVDLDEADQQVSRSIIREVAQSGQAVLTNNAAYDARFAPAESVQFFDLRSIVCVPLKAGQLLGVLYLDNQLMDGAFSAEDEEFLTALAQQAAPLLVRPDFGSRRRQLSVLCLDLYGLTETLEVLGPISRYLEEAEAAVTSRQGSISTATGQALVAVFTSEDHAEKAVAAAQEILARLGGLDVTAGVHSGRSLVGETGSGRLRGLTVLGDAPKLAHEVQKLTREFAQPLLYTEATWWLLGREGSPVGERVLDAGEPVKIYTPKI